MSIEYSREFKVGEKIDLSSPEYSGRKAELPKPETYLPRLKEKLAALAGRLNSEHGDFFTTDGRLKMTGADADYDQDLLIEKVNGWSEEVSKSPAKFLADLEKNPSNITEIATTLLFDKILGDDFIIVRASIYDDYENGADQLIIDKETGVVICGVDEVIGNIGDDGGEKKSKKIEEKMEGGSAKMKNSGVKIKYGATFRNEKLVRKELAHIPLFYFSLSKLELDDLLRSLTADSTANPAETGSSQTEGAVYLKLVDSLKQQFQHYIYDKNLNPRLQDNLRNFYPSLVKMASYVQPK
jgi:hypothetical protein